MRGQTENMDEVVVSSFRDPSGFVFRRDGTYYRQINQVYREDYDHLISSGLYQELVDANLLLPHSEVGIEPQHAESAYKVIRPEQLWFVSYPYEWSFGQLKDAALTHLRILHKALQHDMTLKDCSGYNIQIHHGRAVLIDTLSFERYREGDPWVAYRQFCQHFLAPLSLMAYRDVRLGQMLRTHLDGIPLDLASTLLPWQTYLQPSLLLHVHLHARSQQRHSGKSAPKRQGVFSRNAYAGLIEGLYRAVRRLRWNQATEWTTYYSDLHNYSEASATAKQETVERFLQLTGPAIVWDIGANTGRYSRIASSQGINTVAFDIDPGSVEFNYQQVRKEKDGHLLPLLLDLANPSPGIGWENAERLPLEGRGPADVVLALALVHHLAIGHNVPFAYLARYLHRLCRHLIIEFVPKSDEQVSKLLTSRKDIFDAYTEKNFGAAFREYFRIIEEVSLPGSGRKLYLMVEKSSDT